MCTRPRTANGFGLSANEANTRVLTIEDTMTILPDNEQIYPEWRRLVVRNNVRGVQVHDARLAAATRVHGVSYILTLNQPDFVRYTSITALLPQDVS